MIKTNTLFYLLLSACLTSFFSYSVYAVSDSTAIDISHTYTPYVKFTGTAPGSSRFYSNSVLTQGQTPLADNLGTMGLESNLIGNCSLDFTSDNTFKLLHTVSGVNLGDYTLRYSGLEFNEANNPQLELPCTSAATDLDFILNNKSKIGIGNGKFIAAGIYQDIIHVVVTTQ